MLVKKMAAQGDLPPVESNHELQVPPPIVFQLLYLFRRHLPVIHLLVPS